MNYKKFFHLDSNGNPWGIVSTEQLWANIYAIKYNRPENRLDSKKWESLFNQARTAAIEFGADSIESRIRLEYQKNVDELPDESQTPFKWKTAQELNWNTQQIAQFTMMVTKGALDVDPNEKPEDFIQDWLCHDDLTSGPNCISIGFYNDQPCALTVVQINKDSGWSRISYMGLIISLRGQGLGKWVHRHGFAMMKNQGGKLYHGGTLTHNYAMKKLFKLHNCHIHCEMEEWSCNLKGGIHEAIRS